MNEAIREQMYAGKFTSLGAFDTWLGRSNLLSVCDSQDTWVLLTRQPRVWLDRAGAASSLRLERLHKELSILPYEQGSIFGSEFEIRWHLASRGQDSIHDLNVSVEYVGPPLPDATPLREVPLVKLAGADVRVEEKHFILWGEQIANGLYGEGRLPAEIEYPVNTPARRVRLVSRLYVIDATGQPIARRWVRLEGIS